MTSIFLIITVFIVKKISINIVKTREKCYIKNKIDNEMGDYMTIENLQIVNSNMTDIVKKGKLDKEESKKLTGFASIDRPWEKFYKEGACNITIPKQTLYQALVDYNKSNLDTVAFICGDRQNEKITYQEFIKMVDDIAKGLNALNLKEGDEIISTTKNSVEGIALLFAKSRLGLTVHFIDPSNSVEEKKRMISETKAKNYFMSEEFIEFNKGLADDEHLERIIVMPSLASKEVKHLPESPKYYSYNEMLVKGREKVLPNKIDFDSNKGTIIMYTGGSTGKAKGVILTEHNFLAKYYRQINSNWLWGHDRINLCALPPFIAFGLSDAIVSPILAGETNALEDCLAITKCPEFVLKHKPQDWSCSPIHIEVLVNSPLIDENTDLSHLEMIPCGGDGMNLNADQIARDFFEKHGAKNAFAQGCGFTESVGAFCYGRGPENMPGYMGIPLAGNISAVFDPDTLEELKYGEIGEWAVLTDTMMQGYFGSSYNLTQGALKEHKDGKIWLHPGDMVHMNEDGMIAMHDRTKRTFNYMGMKIYPSALEAILSTHPAVKKCILLGIKSPDAMNIAITDQKIPIVNVTLKDEYKGKEDTIKDELLDLLHKKAPQYLELLAIIFRDNIPFTNRGKNDYQRLENEGIEEAEDRKVYILKPNFK